MMVLAALSLVVIFSVTGIKVYLQEEYLNFAILLTF